jgi:hypothetical protein
MGKYHEKFLAPALVIFPLLGGVPTEAATAAPNDTCCDQSDGRPGDHESCEWCGAVIS